LLWKKGFIPEGFEQNIPCVAVAANFHVLAYFSGGMNKDQLW
jgi:hypothetical protein